MNNDRFVRTQMLLGEEGVRRLQHSRVMIVGLGAVGTYALEALARMGVEHFCLVDFDIIHDSNFNRQLLALEANLGRKKTEAARERVLAINPKCHVVIKDLFFNSDEVENLFEYSADVVIDAIDGLNSKLNLLAACVGRQVPVVASMGAALRTDPLQVRTGDIADVQVCPLALRLRKRLKKLGIEHGIHCVYSLEAPRENQWLPPAEDDYYERGRHRDPLGSLSYLTGIFGLVLAAEVSRLLLGEIITGLPEAEEPDTNVEG